MATISPREIGRMAEEKLQAIKEEEYRERLRVRQQEEEAIKTRERVERTARLLAELDAAGDPLGFEQVEVEGGFEYQIVEDSSPEYRARMAAKQKRMLDLQFAPDRPDWMRF